MFWDIKKEEFYNTTGPFDHSMHLHEGSISNIRKNWVKKPTITYRIWEQIYFFGQNKGKEKDHYFLWLSKREICISLLHIGIQKRRDDFTIQNYLMVADKASEIRR